MPLLPSALPPRGEASHYGANNFLNLIALPLRGPSFQRKEGTTRMPLSPCCHFERMREIFFVRGRAKAVRKADHGKHHMPNNWGSRCFMQTALRRKTKTENEKDPSAALGMTKRENASSHFFSFRGSQPPPLRGTSFQRKEGKTALGHPPFYTLPIPSAPPSHAPEADNLLSS